MAADSNPSPAAAGNAFTLTRVFDVPKAVMFKAWTDAEHLKQWFGPKGFTMLSCKLDLRPGGVFHYGMRAPNGAEMWGKWTFREIAGPDRLSFVASFSDAAGGIIRHPFAANWPLEVLSSLNFAVAEHDGRTAMTMRGIPINATEDERKVFEGAFDGMRQGWAGTMEQLAAHLSEL